MGCNGQDFFKGFFIMLPAHYHDDTYDRIWSKYCRSSQRAQHEIQEQSSNTEERDKSNT